jgi:hypothetical protein
MKITRPLLVTLAGATILSAAPLTAQIHVTPSIGTFIPATDLRDLRSEADQLRIRREGALGLGLNVDAGWLRGSLAYASGATLTESGVQNRDDIGDGSVLAVAADIVFRPLPRIIAQPYLLGGLGYKQQDYSYSRDGLSSPLSRESRDVALHVGIGADVMFGSFGIMAEITDYITRHDDASFGQHDAFAFVGLRVRLGGDR